MRYCVIIFVIILSVSVAHSTPIKPDDCINWECIQTVETGERERSDTREETTYRRVEIQETRYVWNEREVEEEVERREERRSHTERFWYDNGFCEITQTESGHMRDHLNWSENPLITITSENGINTYNIEDPEVCIRIRERVEESRYRSNNSSSSSSQNDIRRWTEGWWEALTVSRWIEVPETIYFTDNWMEEYEYITEICKCTPVPEPPMIILFGTGLIVVVYMIRKNKLKRV